MSGHVERLEAYLDARRARGYDGTIATQAADVSNDPNKPGMYERRPLTDADLRAALDELKGLRAERAEAQGALTVAAELIDRLSFDDACEYDHNDYCQAHNLHERPCPHPLGRHFVAAWRAVEVDAAPQRPEHDRSGM